MGKIYTVIIFAAMSISAITSASDVYECTFSVQSEEKVWQTTGHLFSSEVTGSSLRNSRKATRNARVLGLPFLVGSANWPDSAVYAAMSKSGKVRICAFIYTEAKTILRDVQGTSCVDQGTRSFGIQGRNSDSSKDWTSANVLCHLK